VREINELIIHTTATPNGWKSDESVNVKIREITRWHKDRGFRTIGYHRVIDRDGTVGMGRPFAEAGAHVKGRNKNSIGVSLVGGKTSKRADKFRDNFTAAQRKALNALIADLRTDFGNIKISGHNEYSSKTCPGFQVTEFLAEGDPRTKSTTKPVAAAGLGIAALGAGIAAKPEWWPVAAVCAAVVAAIVLYRKVKR